MTCPDLALGLFLPGLAEVGMRHFISKKVEMLHIETTDLYCPSLHWVNLSLLPSSQGWEAGKNPLLQYPFCSYIPPTLMVLCHNRPQFHSGSSGHMNELGIFKGSSQQLWHSNLGLNKRRIYGMSWSFCPQKPAADFLRKKSLVHRLVCCAAQWSGSRSFYLAIHCCSVWWVFPAAFWVVGCRGKLEDADICGVLGQRFAVLYTEMRGKKASSQPEWPWSQTVSDASWWWLTFSENNYCCAFLLLFLLHKM